MTVFKLDQNECVQTNSFIIPIEIITINEKLELIIWEPLHKSLLQQLAALVHDIDGKHDLAVTPLPVAFFKEINLNKKSINYSKYKNRVSVI